MRSSCCNSSSSSSEVINIAAHARRIDVDNRYSMRFYCRVADNVLRQADIFRREKNVIDLYIMLLRFSSLVSETMPRHRDYKASPQSLKDSLRKKLLNAVIELEELKPTVQLKLLELNRKHTHQVNGWSKFDQDDLSVRQKTLTPYGATQMTKSAPQGFVNQGSRTRQFSYSRPVQGQFHRFVPRAKEETLSKHSVFGPNGLYGQWQQPKSHIKVQYPSMIDLTPVEIPSVQQTVEDGLKTKDSIGTEHDRSSLTSVLNENDDSRMPKAEEPRSLISFDTAETSEDINIIRQPSPPPVLAQVQDLIPAMSLQVPEANCGLDNTSPDDFVSSESPMQLHISTTIMESFLKLAKSNTDKNLETCGVLAGSLKNRKFYVTALIIPKQTSTSDTCQTTNEEEIFEVQDKQSLFPLGWIHTHPTQSCFMSSVDLHTHYSYQTMLPEAVAIVMAPRDTSRRHGIFRLTTPGGMSVIRQCQQRGFHPHDSPPDGGPIYATCPDVYMNPNLKFDVIDLR